MSNKTIMMRRFNLFAALALMCASLMLTSCRGKYSDALVVMGYEMVSNGGSCSDMWYVLPDGRSVHEQNLAGDRFTSSASYVVNKDSMTIRLYNYEQYEGAEESRTGYLLKFNLEKQSLRCTVIDCNGDIDQGPTFSGITGPAVKHVDWEGVKALFENCDK